MIWIIAVAVLVVVGCWFAGNVLRNRREKARLDHHEQSIVVLSTHQTGFAEAVYVLSYNGITPYSFSYQGECAIYLPVGQIDLVVQAQIDEAIRPHQVSVNVDQKSVYHLRYDLNTAQYQFEIYAK